MIMKKEEMKITELYDLPYAGFRLSETVYYPWDALAGLSDFYHDWEIAWIQAEI